MWLLAGQKAPDHSTKKSKSGYESEVTVYECEDCTNCPHKEKCTRAKGNKRLYISKSFLEKRQESYENILSETGIQYRTNRSIQVEGAFGVLKNDYEFQRFLLRGKTKVKLEILLLCMGVMSITAEAAAQSSIVDDFATAPFCTFFCTNRGSCGVMFLLRFLCGGLSGRNADLYLCSFSWFTGIDKSIAWPIKDLKSAVGIIDCNICALA